MGLDRLKVSKETKQKEIPSIQQHSLKKKKKQFSRNFSLNQMCHEVHENDIFNFNF